ncbi:MAG: DUF3108 domain-containing protein, partial [Pseudomonadota bacterium]
MSGKATAWLAWQRQCARLPRALCIALSVSLLLHVYLLFAPNFNLALATTQALPLQAELLMPRTSQAPQTPNVRPALDLAAPSVVARQAVASEPQQSASTPQPESGMTNDAKRAGEESAWAEETHANPALPSASAVVTEAAAKAVTEAITQQSVAPNNHAATLAQNTHALAQASASVATGNSVASTFPSSGEIDYRVERMQGLEIGQSKHRWQISQGHYQMSAVSETSGLVALFKPLRIEWESSGQMNEQGFQPTRFVIRRGNGKTPGSVEAQAEFDWASVQVRLNDLAPQTLKANTQDLLSFHYQLGH